MIDAVPTWAWWTISVVSWSLVVACAYLLIRGARPGDDS